MIRWECNVVQYAIRIHSVKIILQLKLVTFNKFPYFKVKTVNSFVKVTIYN